VKMAGWRTNFQNMSIKVLEGIATREGLNHIFELQNTLLPSIMVESDAS